MAFNRGIDSNKHPLVYVTEVMQVDACVSVWPARWDTTLTPIKGNLLDFRIRGFVNVNIECP